MRSTSSTLAVSMMIGVTSLAARRRRQIDRPSSPGQHQVEHDQVDGLASQQAVQRLGIFGEQDFEAFLGQVAAQQVADACIVVDDHHAVGAGIGGCIHGRGSKFVTAAW